MARLGLGALLALCGCAQSPFDQHPEDPDVDGPLADASDAPVTDAPPSCPDPCLGDAVGEFLAGGWEYRADLRDPRGVAYEPLVVTTIDGAPAVDDGGAAPQIVDCSIHDEGVCADAAGGLVLTPSPTGAGADPVLGLRIPQSGLVRVTGAARRVAGAEARLLVSRQSRNDLVAVIPLTAEDVPFDVVLEAVAEDLLLLTVQQVAAGDPPRVALTAFASDGGGFGEQCQLMITFDGDGLTDACRGLVFTDHGTATHTSIADGASPDYREAIHFEEGTEVRTTDYIRYGDTFTFDLWMRLRNDPFGITETAYGDAACRDVDAMQGGLSIWHDGLDLSVNYYHDGPSTPPQCDLAATPMLTIDEPDAEWHLYRIVREGTRNEIALCVDGVVVDVGTLERSETMLSGRVPTLGRDGVFGAATFKDDIDDVRVVLRALPCL